MKDCPAKATWIISSNVVKISATHSHDVLGNNDISLFVKLKRIEILLHELAKTSTEKPLDLYTSVLSKFEGVDAPGSFKSKMLNSIKCMRFNHQVCKL